MASAPPSLLPLLESRRVVLCVGCGGVGKTTVAAALGLAAARRGMRVLTLTIDPAKRLANSLGLSRMTTEAQKVDPALFEKSGVPVSGSLTVMMLDTKKTFDELVDRYASGPEARDRILDNRLYQYVSTSLAGTQDYMAMEKLLSVKEDESYDLIVLDTPPTRNALDFLDAPSRLVEALDSAAIRWFIQAFDTSRKLSFNLVAQGVAVVLKGLSKITGGGFLDQIAGLIVDLNDLFGGFKERATRVSEAFRGSDFGYVMITSPSPLAIEEIIYFAERLDEQGITSDAFVVNRLHRKPRARPTVEQIEEAISRHGLALDDDASVRIDRAIADEFSLAERDARNIDALYRALPGGVRQQGSHFVRIPALPGDVHDIRTLAGVGTILCPELAS